MEKKTKQPEKDLISIDQLNQIIDSRVSETTPKHNIFELSELKLSSFDLSTKELISSGLNVLRNKQAMNYLEGKKNEKKLLGYTT